MFNIHNGVMPSYIWLQKGPWKTMLAFLIERFPHISADHWQERMACGKVLDEHHRPLSPTSPYRWGGRIFYYRDIEKEIVIPFKEHILFKDQHIVVVDKPHFLPVIPSGRFLRETLLVRLKQQFPHDLLSPIHRLDRETAGVIIFSVNPTSRGKYQQLFQQRAMIKEYEALAPHLGSYESPFIYRSRLENGTPFFRMQEVAGVPNAETHIELIERINTISRYRLRPLTGRKHQLRVHLSSLEIPILNDAFYPIAQPCKGDDVSQPLQLLAKSIAFIDPITGQERYFESKQQLEC